MKLGIQEVMNDGTLSRGVFLIHTPSFERHTGDTEKVTIMTIKTITFRIASSPLLTVNVVAFEDTKT